MCDSQLPENNTGDAIAVNFICQDEPNWGFLDEELEEEEKHHCHHKQYEYPIGRIMGRGVGLVCCRALSIKEGSTGW
ncbi:hypothetical protein Cri9333_0526 [Crinalium epipsammum PCC 9333]|uniref:Uncharacterized protein n=2 Tax=Crinalium TaxID=241421 RepID=K9VVF2_9CYAN|nr:hypothetical protein Cri9333_0526 [Crinalium epipsammum PCC 9333]